MSYKPDEKDWMAYLYDEMEGEEKERMEQYLLSHPEARKELEGFHQLRNVMGTVKDKEVIAPPLVLGDSRQRFIWNAPYLKTIISIAASLLLVMLVGRFTGTSVNFSDGEMKISFGGKTAPAIQTAQEEKLLTADEVQQMINSSLNKSNLAMQANWQESQTKLDASIRSNLAMNSGKVDQLVRQASKASQEQIRLYVSGLQSENTQLVKDYFQLSNAEQKKYIENLLVDFSKYLQQQRNDDLRLVQSKLQNLEQDTDLFKQETEQILSSIITSVGQTPVTDSKTTAY